MLLSCTRPETMPPTSDALTFHMRRAWYQGMVWQKATEAHPELPSLERCGWEKDNNLLIPIKMMKDLISQAVQEIISCNCKGGCNSATPCGAAVSEGCTCAPGSATGLQRCARTMCTLNRGKFACIILFNIGPTSYSYLHPRAK